MTYQEYQRKCASWGHIESPLSWKDFEWLVSHGFKSDSIFSVSDDIAAGYGMAEAVQALGEE